MAQVARAHTDAAGGDPRSLKRLAVQFRGMGFPEQEIVVTGDRQRGRRRPVVDRDVAAQGDNRIIRNAEAELELSPLARAGGRRGPRISPCSPSASRRSSPRSSTPTWSRGGPWARRRSPSAARSTGAPPRCAPSWPRSRRDGYLTHPHTSAGRVPTDAGYRLYADSLLAARGRSRRAGRRGSSSRGCARGRRGDAGDDDRALADHRPAGPGHRAAARARAIHRVEVLRCSPGS